MKLFVAATPISGPQFSPMTTSDSCDSDEFRWLTRDKIFALSYISNVNTFLCNETGEDIFYVSDDYGFRNNNKVWKEDVEFAFIGDSFVHGGCVEDNYTLSNILSKKVNKNVLNLGVGGAGPLIEYAIFKEYASKKKPKKVFWFFSYNMTS